MFLTAVCLLFASLASANPLLTEKPSEDDVSLAERISALEASVENLATQQRRDQERISALERLLSEIRTRGKISRKASTQTPRYEDGFAFTATGLPTELEEDWYTLTTTEETPTSTETEEYFSISRFFEAAERGDTDYVFEFVNASRSAVRLRNAYGDTALHVAARAGKVDVVKLLLEMGSWVEMRGHCLKTALHYAAVAGHIRVVRLLLLSSSSAARIVDCSQKTAFDLAFNAGLVDVVEVLTPLNNVENIQHLALQQAKSENIDMFKALLSSGLHFRKDYLQLMLNNVWNQESMWLVLDAADHAPFQQSELSRALFEASKSGHCAALQSLIAAGADIGYYSLAGTPLIVATQYRQIGCVRVLIGLGGSGVQRGMSALNMSAESNCPECMKLLLDGDFVNKRVLNTSINDGTLMNLALKSRCYKCAKILVDVGAVIPKMNVPNRDVLLATKNCDTELLEMYIKGGAEINFVDEYLGISLLAVAVQRKNEECVHLLLRSGANPNLKMSTYNGRANSALHEAVINDDVDIARALIESGADINLVGENGRTPRSLARSDEMKKLMDRASRVTRTTVAP